MMDLQLEEVQTSLTKILGFVLPYLPMANAHGRNFITDDQWNSHLTKGIQDELMSLSHSELQTLPCSLMQSWHERNLNQSGSDTTSNTSAVSAEVLDVVSDPHNTDQQCDPNSNYNQSGSDTTSKTSADVPHITDQHCDPNCKQQDTRAETNGEVETLQCQKIWGNRNITQFCQSAFSNTVEGCGVLLSLETLVTSLGASTTKDIFIDEFMNLKKSHEVEVMSQVCALLVKETNCQLVVDFGSGKGYLGNNLAMQYNIPVLGIDAMSSYTESAEKRMYLLGKQWNGLALNAATGSQTLTHKEKKKRNKEKKKRKATNAEADRNQQKILSESEDCADKHELTLTDNFKTDGANITSSRDIKDETSNKYVPVTLFVDKSTNFIELALENFPDLFEEHGACSEVVIGSDLGDSASDTCTQTVKPCNLPSIQAQTGKPCNLPSFQAQTGKPCNLLLTGLHTCGNLACTTLYLFVNNSNLKSLCSVGCCYNMLDEEFIPDIKYGTKGSGGFPMSKFLRDQRIGIGSTARNLSVQSIHRISSKQEALQGERFFHRALLEKVVQDTCGQDGITWKGLRNLEKKCTSTEEYIRKACEKQDISHLISDDTIESYVKQYADCKHQLAAFFQLRAVLAPCIESLILLDRVCYLLEQENIRKVHLVKLFDPVVSPRCYGIVAFKH